MATILEGAQVAADPVHHHGLRRSPAGADNETAEGRQANRRVDIAIMANDKLKDAAEKKTEG